METEEKRKGSESALQSFHYWSWFKPIRGPHQMLTSQFKFLLVCLMLPKLTSSHVPLRYDIISSALSVFLFPKNAAQTFSATLPNGLGEF